MSPQHFVSGEWRPIGASPRRWAAQQEALRRQAWERAHALDRKVLLRDLDARAMGMRVEGRTLTSAQDRELRRLVSTKPRYVRAVLDRRLPPPAVRDDPALAKPPLLGSYERLVREAEAAGWPVSRKLRLAVGMERLGLMRGARPQLDQLTDHLQLARERLAAQRIGQPDSRPLQRRR